MKTGYKISGFMKNRKFIILSIILFVSAIGLIGCLFYAQMMTNSPNIKIPNGLTYSSPDNKDINDKVAQKVSEGGVDAGINYLNSKLNEANSPQSRAVIYLDLARLTGSASGGGNQQAALDYALKAEKTHSTYNSALMVAESYESLGSVKDAISYYKLYLYRYDIYRKANTIEPSDDDYDYYAEYLSVLESKQ